MPVIMSRPPLEATTESLGKSSMMMPVYEVRSSLPRPVSNVTETTDLTETDFEDDSDSDQRSHKGSFESVRHGIRCKAQTFH